MNPDIANAVFDVNYGPLFLILSGLAFGTWWIIKWVFDNQKQLQAQNAERENRYLTVIDTQARSLQMFEETQKDVKDIKTILLRRD